MAIHNYSNKAIHITQFCVCRSCKNRVKISALKHVPVFAKNGKTMVKGMCYVCGHFVRFIPLMDTKYFSFKNKRFKKGDVI